uniref:Beta-mannosidase Ig-fold domain-containing protein n=1 Tax=Arion vulgaris TaxID=1028688 RepID=A0A0B6ZRQ6_9EUPU
MVWQDMMFSVAMYPVYQEFLDSVATEIRQQVRRLKHHPSILCWAGNNENELALRQNWFGTFVNFTLYYDNYVQLYVKVIQSVILSEDSTRDYLVSSPSDGEESVREGYVAQDPASELYGDIHYYDYSVDQWNASSFKIPRMASEYGVQSWCNNESLANVFAPEDFQMGSSMVNHRQHHPGGNDQMALEVGLHLNLPNSTNATSNFIDFIYLTQINQAMSIRTQSEHYRRYQSQLQSDARGLTMGALYWQLNDIWQAPTWASIDYEGSWKMLHYYARSFFNKNLVSPYLKDSDTLDVFMIIDEIPVMKVRSCDGKLSFQPVFNMADLIRMEYPADRISEALWDMSRSTAGNLSVQIYNYKSFNVLFSWSTTYNVKTTAESVFTKKISDLLSESGCPSVEDCLLFLTATDFSGTVVSTSWLPLAYPKFSSLLPAEVKIDSVTSIDDYTFNIQVSTDAIALFVWLATDNIHGYFSDNGFVMLTPSIQIQFHAQEVVTVDQLSSLLHVRSVSQVK